jgi:hypothetical protein
MSEMVYLGRYEDRKGRRGQNAFAEYLREVHKKDRVEIRNNPMNRRDVDVVTVDEHGKPIGVYEVTNYKKTTWMSRPRAKRYIDNLKGWETSNSDIYKAIVVAYIENVDKIKGLRKKNYLNRQ